MKKGRPSIIHYGDTLDHKTLNDLIYFYEQRYNDAIQFRDAITKRYKAREPPLE